MGVIEGFFGPMWSWSERSYVVRTLANAQYSFYLYAPKGDAALRRQWSEPFSQEWMDSIRAFTAICKSLNVAFGVGFSPYGLQSDFGEMQRALLLRKLSELASLKLDYLAILFDDMDAGVPELAGTQTRIVDAIVNCGAAGRYIVCPSYYSDDVVLDVVFGQRPERYLRSLCGALDPSIDVFWTGEEVCARHIGTSHLARVAEEMGRKPLLWDNYPVNDGARMSSHLHLRAFTGRDPAIAEFISGHAINPALQPVLSTIPAITLTMNYSQHSAYAYGDAFMVAATQVLGLPMARFLQEDLIALQDLGLHRYDIERKNKLHARYTAIDHPAAREIVRWLDGEYSASSELVQTQ
jgi:hyaluronoglucosaminidase